ncbi:MAG TPA: hypothetical protein VFC29_19900 [Candidatus Limnocylindrales bacterium]|nr:hypothetical protein [Candidatus Limnocylindrales bacterium]
MTLCVAAQCVDGEKNKVVFASDFSVETEISSAEIESKLGFVGDEDYPVLYAGSSSRARELGNVLNDILMARGEEESGLMSDYCKQAVKQQKAKLADEYVGALLGMSFESLLRQRDRFPEELYRDTLNEIARMSLGCDLVLIAFSSGQSQLIRINGTGVNVGGTELCFNFAAIGSGFYLAEASLFQREHSSDDSLEDTIYQVYEAMVLGAKAPGVGEDFHISIASDAGDHIEWEHLDDALYFDYLAKQFRKFGPKELRPQQIQRQWIMRTKLHGS